MANARTRIFIALSLGASLAACEGPAGPAGGNCTITTADGGGATTISCPGSSPVTIGGGGGSCSVERADGGGQALRCGTTVTPLPGVCTLDPADGGSTLTCPGMAPVTIADGRPCTVTEMPDAGIRTVTCPGSPPVTIRDGTTGASCSVTDNADGSSTVSCTDGTSAVILPPGSGEGTGLNAAVTVAPPAAGGFYAAGERIVVTITLTDSVGQPLALADLSTAALYMTGPRRRADAVTAVGLLGAATDREVRPHHYIDFKVTPAPTDLVVMDNVLVYTMRAITTEAAGTYQIGFRGKNATPGADLRTDEVFELVDVQLGTATVDPMIVGNCVDCHGAANGQMYFAHIDRGSISIDSDPIRTCIMCHNQEGYAAFSSCSDGSRPPCAAPLTTVRTPDPIVRRVHGVHMGVGLTNVFNVGPRGDFEDYEELVFPAGRTNCAKCHVDDAWNTRPSRQACTTCHDALNFTTGAYSPPRARAYSTTAVTATAGRCTTDTQCTGTRFPYGTWTCNTTSGYCEKATHAGGTAADAACSTCHTPTGSGPSITEVHRAPAPTPPLNVDISISPPTTGTFYTTETPVVTIALTATTGGAVVVPSSITDNGATPWSNAYLYVSGPRENTRPVLSFAATGTAAVRAETRTGRGPFNLNISGTLDLRIDGTAVSVPLVASAFATPATATATEVQNWLRADAGFAAAATALRSSSASTGDIVRIRSNTRGTGSSVEVLPGTVATALGLVGGVNVPTITASYMSNDLRLHADALDDDPRVTRSATAFQYQLDSVAGLVPGTYTLYARFQQTSSVEYSIDLLTFQVGSGGQACAAATPCATGLLCDSGVCVEPRVATNCVRCHENTRMHGSLAPFDPDYCKNCHDYQRQILGRVGWASLGSNMGYGAAPLSRRVHGVHRGHYLDKPAQVHASFDYSGVIFPQDIRSCETCHSQGDSWAQSPGRVACLGCHDSDAAIGHGQLMTVDPTAADPYSQDETETCDVCHGDGRDYSVEAVHNISNPFRLPYAR